MPSVIQDRVPVVEVTAVSKSYRSPMGSVRHVLGGVNLTIESGSSLSVVGPSGSGKSTLIALLGGLLTPDAGTVSIGGRLLDSLRDSELSRLRASRIGTVLQTGNLIPFLTAAENVELAVELAGGTAAAERAVAVLEDLSVAQRASHLPRRLSGGEAQRVALAVAVVNEPQLLLADEVTGQLDAQTADRVISTILQVASQRGTAVVFSTHSPALAARAERQYRIVDCRLVPI